MGLHLDDAVAKRPSLYVYALYPEHFGPILLDVDVECGTYHAGRVTPYLSVNASRSEDGKTVYLMIVNKHLDESVATTVSLPGGEIGSARAWCLTGTRIDSWNDREPGAVGVADIGAVVGSGGVRVELPKHSVAAVEVGGR